MTTHQKTVNDDLLGVPITITEGIGTKRRPVDLPEHERQHRHRQARLAKPTASVVFGPGDAMGATRATD